MSTETDCCLLVPCINETKDVDKRTLRIVNPLEFTKTYVKGLGTARNELAKKSKNDYLLFVDCGVYFSEETFETYIKPAIQERKLLIYRGGNEILCTKVFGISRKLFYELGGFDESFHIGEDLELGLRIPDWVERIEIPNDLINHIEHEKRAGYINNMGVRVRLALRYRRLDFLGIKRKKDLFGVFFTPFLLVFYVFHNKRENIQTE